MTAKRNEKGKFVGDPDDGVLGEMEFCADTSAVEALAVFLASEAGQKLRWVLRQKRRALVAKAPTDPTAAAATLAKLQAFEEFTELIIDRLTKAKQAQRKTASSKAFDYITPTHLP
jgi:hypothetical protein